MSAPMHALVVATDDPEKRGRVKLAIPELFLDHDTDTVVDSPWCDCKGGGMAGGWLDVPDVGTQVLAQVQHTSSGDTLEIVYERGRHGTQDGVSTAPTTGRGEDDNSVFMKVSAPFQVPSPASGLERKSPQGAVTRGSNTERLDLQLPTSKNAGKYPSNRVLKTSGGFVIEIDDTAGEERFQLHTPGGAGLEVSSKGTWTQRMAKRFEDVAEHDVRHVGGDQRVRVDGHDLRGVGGNQIAEVGGRSVLMAGEIDLRSRFDLLMEVAGQMRQTVVGVTSQRYLSDWRVTCGQNASITAASNLSLVAALGSINLSSVKGVNISGPLFNAVTAATTINSAGVVNIASGLAMGIEAGAAVNVAAGDAVNVVAGGAVNIGAGALINVTATAGMNVIGPAALPVPYPVVVGHPSFILLLQAILSHTHAAPGTTSAEIDTIKINDPLVLLECFSAALRATGFAP